MPTKMTGDHFATVARAVHRAHTERLTDIGTVAPPYQGALADEVAASHDAVVRALASALAPLASRGGKGTTNFDQERFVAQCNGAPVKTKPVPTHRPCTCRDHTWSQAAVHPTCPQHGGQS
jgi:hypothetical protein